MHERRIAFGEEQERDRVRDQGEEILGAGWRRTARRVRRRAGVAWRD